ncbi:hypothetical protein QBC41DRAFT_353560 [Cercophora samala]|uniref:Uncharacterized protein n=1 Tax=Cercophora samala TaxID=330535 RepID=A0AA39ZJV4_9PEZI|nr:hypothetical protein QBC41DRAFT_353560 [Cercophora samala]
MLSITTLAASALAFFGGYTLPDNVTDVTWNLPIYPADKGSAAVSFTGTIEQAVAKMEADYPGWKASLLAQSAAPFGVKAETPYHLDFNKANCTNPGHFTASTLAIKKGISYLSALDGIAKNGPGPRNCGRVSCSDSSGIWWCNDVWRGARTRCADKFAVDRGSVYDRGDDTVVGEVESTGGKWSVIVRVADC